jgi:hypothetical protein
VEYGVNEVVLSVRTDRMTPYLLSLTIQVRLQVEKE